MSPPSSSARRWQPSAARCSALCSASIREWVPSLCLSAALRSIHGDGVAILLVEQNAAMALRLASRGYLLETGRCVAEDTTKALMSNDYVRKAYLGI